MELLSLLDAAIVAPAAVLGLLGLWLGFGRSLVAWPMRWVIPLLGAYAAGRLTELCLVFVWDMVPLLHLMGPPVGWVGFIIVFLAMIVPLLMFMDNLTARVKVWTAAHRIEFGERVLGGLLGMACGLIVVAVVIEHTPLRREMAGEPAWVRASVLLPHLRSASDTVASAVAFALSAAAGLRRWW
jgi:uncharacterized membrane protein required for colicin V production